MAPASIIKKYAKRKKKKSFFNLFFLLNKGTLVLKKHKARVQKASRTKSGIAQDIHLHKH